MSGVGDRAQGRWKSILPMLGIDGSFLTGKHGPCPMCGGTDRFRFDNKVQRGTWICTACGSGDGITLVCKAKGWDFKTCAREVEKLVGAVPVERIERTADQNIAWVRKVCTDLWSVADLVVRECPVTRYLDQRGIRRDAYPRILRSMKACRYDVKGSEPLYYPAMIAKIVTHDDRAVGIHRTYLDDQAFSKIDRKMFGGHPAGSAVRLGEPAAVMGIAEGIETALSASALWQVPCWAALTADRLMTWEPPKDVQEVFVFGDNDVSYTGQAAAYGLARKLTMRGIAARVMIPEQGDWNDVLVASTPQVQG